MGTRRTITNVLLPAAALGLLANSAAAFDTDTEDKGALIAKGQYAAQNRWGTDLGFSALHDDERVHISFGDTYLSDNPLEDFPNNDSMAYFDPTTYPNSSVVPVLNWEPGLIEVYREDGSTPGGLNMGGAKTPRSSYSTINGGSYQGSFLRGGVYMKCSTDADCGDLTCDESMGIILGSTNDDTFTPCWKYAINRASTGLCLSVDGNPTRGLCRDPNSPMAGFVRFVAGGVPQYDFEDGDMRSDWGKILSTGAVIEEGKATGPITTYETRQFITSRFLNATTRITRPDYTPSDPTDAVGLVWTWGRPSFMSQPEFNAKAPVYLSVESHDGTDPTGRMFWSQTGWKPSQTQAEAILADDDWEDGAPVAGHMSVTYLVNAHKWVMLYGGGQSTIWGTLFMPAQAYGVDIESGTVKMRVADDPWGPWSEPEDVIAPSDVDDLCDNAFCAAFPPFKEFGNGVLYGFGIVEAWNESTATTGTIGWFVSLWNPYQVQMMRTEITGL